MTGPDVSQPGEFPPPPGNLPGLTEAEAGQRFRVQGPNLLVPDTGRSGWWSVVWRSVTEPMSILLVVAAVTYLLLGDAVDGVAAIVALLPIVGVSVVLERRAERALDELAALTAPTARVWRDRRWQAIPAASVVAGDVVGVQEGDIVPADGILGPGTAVMIDESSLTGESLPVTKDGETADQVWAGTTVLTGRAAMTVTATGTTTRYGQIGHLVAETGITRTPLEESIRTLVLRLSVVAGVFAVLVGATSLGRGGSLGDAIIAGVSLGMAAIPEEFPLVFTLYLALGARRIARHRALVRRLTGVETLGSTTVICTDKTGTLTAGALTVSHVTPSDGHQPTDLLEAAVLASEVTPFDPLDKAIVARAESAGVNVDRLHERMLVSDFDFDPATKNVTHVWGHDGELAVASKGALEGILSLTNPDTEIRRWAETEMERLGAEGIRVVGVASGSLPGVPANRHEAESSLQFLGLIGFIDPTRPEVPQAITECRNAGIRIVMITGDHPITARSVADGLGLPDEQVVTGDDLDQADSIRDASVFARIRPEQKHRIVSELRTRGEVVAMTGDGVNDAPALREADIGVAMGQRGTAVAREAATLVLLDDNFATIVEAVREGRRIYANLRNAFSYLVAFHVPLLILALFIPILGEPLLLFPFHLIALEFLLHPIVALAFENDPPPVGIMNRPPRRRGEGLLGRWLIAPAVRGLTLATATGALYLAQLSDGEEVARGIALACLFTGELLLVLTERTRKTEAKNRVLLPLLLAGAAVVAVLFLLPGLHQVMGITAVTPEGWLLAVGIAAFATLWAIPLKRWGYPNKRHPVTASTGQPSS
ncbi:MAG TPA: cation-transporting P-type ATPase [Acidimicrobiia bacterium]